MWRNDAAFFRVLTVGLKPEGDHLREVGKGEAVFLPLQSRAQARKFSAKLSVPFRNRLTSRKSLASRSGTKPVAYLCNSLFRLSAVGVNILPRYVGQKGTVAVLIAIENQAALLSLGGFSETFSSEEQAQLQRHIKTR